MKHTLRILLLFALNFSAIYAQKPTERALICGTNEGGLSQESLDIIKNAQNYLTKKKASRNAASSKRVCRIAVEVDYDTYEKYHKDTLLVKREVYRQVKIASEIYENSTNIRLIVTLIKIRTSPELDPYYGIKHALVLLFKLSEIWTNTNTTPEFINLRSQYDKVIYLSTKTYTWAGGVAFMPGITSVAPLLNPSIIAHELGHNLGSPHTQSCLWLEGKLDHCVSGEEDECGEVALENINGTIMSYCDQTNGFHPLCAAVIEQYALMDLQEQSSQIRPVVLNQDYVMESSMIFWSPSVQAESYIVEVAKDDNFANIVIQDTTNIPYLTLTSLSPSRSYFLRIRAVNSIGVSEWSNTAKIKVKTTLLPPKILNVPKDWILDIRANNPISIMPNEDADAFEVQIKRNPIINFEYPDAAFKFSGNKTQIPYINNLMNDIYWIRIRSLKDSLKGEWSESYNVWLYNPKSPFQLPYATMLSTPTIPMVFIADHFALKDKLDVTLRVSPEDNLSNVIYQKTIKASNISSFDSGPYSYRLNKLEANKKYRAIIEYNSSSRWPQFYIPRGTLLKDTITFVCSGVISDTSNVKYAGMDTIEDLGNIDVDATISDKHFIYKSSRGIVLFDLNTFTPTILNHQSTNGALGRGNMIGLGINGKNIQTISKISENGELNEYGTRDPIYAIRTIDAQTGQLTNSSTIFKTRYSRIKLVDFKNNIFYGSFDNYVYGFRKIVNDTLVKMFTLPLLAGDVTPDPLLSEKYAWFSSYEFRTKQAYISRMSLIDGSVSTYNANHLKEASFNPQGDYLDLKGNYWLYNETAVARFNGTEWTIFHKNNSLVRNPSKITEDSKTGDIYLLDSGRILKYSEDKWIEISNMLLPSQLLLKMFIDKNGRFWFLYKGFILRVDQCSGKISTPTLSTSADITEYGNDVAITASGCENILWSWENKKTKNTLLSMEKNLSIKANFSTTYSASCYEKNCIGKAAETKITVNPILRIDSVSKTCVNEKLKLYGRFLGDINYESNFFITTVVSNARQHSSIPNLSYVDLMGNVYMELSTKNMESGNFTVRAESSSPKVYSKDTLRGTIFGLPPVKMLTKPTCVGSDLLLEASGAKSYTFYLNNQMYQGSVLYPKAPITLNKMYAKVIGIDQNGCQNVDSTQITINSLPTVKINIPTQIYKGTNLELKASGANSYQWRGPNGFTSTSPNPVINDIQYTQVGQYSVIGTDLNGCNNTAMANVEILLPLGVEYDSVQGVSVFPNPTSDIISVKSSSKNITSIRIIDSLGKEQFNDNFKEVISIPVDTYVSGTYFIVLENEKGAAPIVLKFIIQR